jgi:hypothetical protein
VLHHFPDAEYAVRELHRTLKPKRSIALIEPNGSHPIIRMGRVLNMGFCPCIRDTSLATSPNEMRAHSGKFYAGLLRKVGFRDVVVTSCTVESVARGAKAGGVDRTSDRVQGFVWSWRTLLCHLTDALLPEPYKGVDVYISGVSGRNDP